MVNATSARKTATKSRESREAYEFIEKQVQEYHRKLTDAENNLQDYRSRNADAQYGSVWTVELMMFWFRVLAAGIAPSLSRAPTSTREGRVDPPSAVYL